MNVASPSHAAAETERNFKQPYAWVGMEAVFYTNGDTNVTPAAGIVTRVDNRSLLMTVFHPSTQPMYPVNIRHTDDPYVKNRPDLLGRRGQGTWDYSEASREALKHLATPKVDNEMTQKILEMDAEGLNSNEIAKALDNGMKFQTILAILRKHK